MNYPLYEAKKQITSILKDTLSKLKYTHEIKLEIPPEEMGDFAFPCFQLAPIAKKSPNDIAKEISQKIKKDKWIEKIEVKGSYVNFFINKKILQTETIKLILEKKDKYGFLNKKNKKVIVEHTSANPNGPLHVGRARNPIIGDTIVRILRMAGYNVESQFYLDDMGKQATILAWGYNNKEVTKEINELYNINKFYPGGSKNFAHKSDHQRVGFYQIASNRMKEDEKTLSEINELIKSSENSFGVRGVIGANWSLENAPIELFIEMAPVFRLFPSTSTSHRSVLP